MNFPQRIKRIRLEAGLTQAGMATHLRRPTSTYKSWERAVCLPSPNNLANLMCRLHANAEDIRRAYLHDKMAE